MPSYIVKPDREQDFYVLWSDITECPIAWGPRAELQEDWRGLGDHNGPWDPERIVRADRKGTSALWPTREAPAYGWDGGGFIYMQRGWLKRDRLVEMCRRLGEQKDVTDLLEPFDDQDSVRPEAS